MITIVGLGTEAGSLTLKGLRALREADEVLVRTSSLSSVKTLDEEGIAYSTLDELYESSRNYDSFTQKAVREVRRRAKEKNFCYCTDGGVTEDRIACLLYEKGDCAVVAGESKAARFAALAGIYGGYSACSAFELEGRTLTLPLVVYDLTPANAGDVKLLLTEKFGDEAPTYYICGDKKRLIALYETDWQEEYGSRVAIVVPDIPLLKKKRFSFEDFIAILRRLRAPDGCPWDRAQTHESIRINALEEAYELVDAIDRDDAERMCEETGDVLMQAAFHALIEEERGGFTVGDMLTGVSEKLITRHTHVFGTDAAQANADGALSVWEKNKMKEKHQITYSDAVNDVPQCFPALLRAQKIVKRMAKGGWNFQTVENCKLKFAEEAKELEEAVKSGDKAQIAGEFGDVLMVLMHVAYMLGIDAEQALLDVVKKTAARFTEWERLVLADGKDVHELSGEEWYDYYRRAKETTY